MPDEPTHGRDAAAWSPLDSDGWYAARDATTALRDVLVRAGLEADTAETGTTVVKDRRLPKNTREGPDAMTDRRGVVAKRAENLSPGVPYVRGWNRARQSASALADQLVLLGLDADFPGLVADVNVFGDSSGTFVLRRSSCWRG